MKESGRNRRRELFSHPTVQIRIILVFVCLSILYAATICWVSKAALQKMAENTLELPLDSGNRSDVNILYDQYSAVLNLQLAVFTFVSIVTLVMGGVYLSHQIAGPIYQLTKYLGDLSAGRTEPREIVFRKNDFFQSLATQFNDFQKKRGMLPPDDGNGPAGKPG